MIFYLIFAPLTTNKDIMKIELKAIKFSASQSEETNAFTGEVYIDGKKAAHARNSGRGGCTMIQAYPGFVDTLVKAEAYAKTLPKVQGLKMDLEFYLDLQVDEFLKKKEEAKLDKLMLKSIVFKKKNGELAYISYKGHTIAEIIKSEKGREILKDLFQRLRKDGSTILNKNIAGVYHDA